MKNPHVYAGNPLDRGESERRDEEGISNNARDPRSKFLPMRNLNVLITVNRYFPDGIQCFHKHTILGWHNCTTTR